MTALDNSVLFRFLQEIFNLSKNGLWDAIWCPKCSKVRPKGLPNGAPGAHFASFFCKKPSLHPTAYLLCFRHISGVLGCPFGKKPQQKMCVDYRSPKKASGVCLFLIFMRRCTKMGAQMGGAKVPKTALFLIGPPLGAPGEHEATKMEPKGSKMTPAPK